MSRQQPVTQVRLTNIAVVRYKVKGLRFEIACFPNKVLDYRKKIEKDLYNVIQSDSIFSNVGKGQFARRSDVQEAFGTLDIKTIISTILEKGEMQVTEKERQAEIASKTKEIINLVAGMCINSETKQPISNRVIEQALKESAFQINLQIPVKSQAMKVFRLLSQTLPIERVKMKILISCPTQYTKQIKLLITNYNAEDKKYNIILSNIAQTQHSVEFTLVVDPGYLREITDDVKVKTNGQGDVSVVDMQVERDELLSAADNRLDTDAIDEIVAPKDTKTLLAIEQINNVNNDLNFTKQQPNNNNNNKNDGGNIDEDALLETKQSNVIIKPIIQRAGINPNRPPVTRPGGKPPGATTQPQQQQQQPPKPQATVKNYGSHDDDDSDDDIMAILNRNDKVTVLREEDEAANTTSSSSVVFTNHTSTQHTDKKSNRLSDFVTGHVDYSEDDDEGNNGQYNGIYNNNNISDDDEINQEYRNDLKKQYSSAKKVSFASGFDDDYDDEGYEYDEEQDAADTQQQKHNNNSVETVQNEDNTTPNMFAHYIITNPSIIDKSVTIAPNMSSKDLIKQQYISKWDKRRILYRDFMEHFDNDDEYQKFPMYKQDLETLEQIHRSTYLSANAEEIEWIVDDDTGNA